LLLKDAKSEDKTQQANNNVIGSLILTIIQFTLNMRGHFVDFLSLRLFGFRPWLLDTTSQQSVDDRTKNIETAADKEHVHPFFTRSLRTNNTHQLIQLILITGDSSKNHNHWWL